MAANKKKNIVDISEISNVEAPAPVVFTKEEQIEALTKDVESMKEKQVEKIEGAIKHLCDSLNVAAQKLRTATGVAAALEIVNRLDLSSLDVIDCIHISKSVSEEYDDLAHVIEVYCENNGIEDIAGIEYLLDNCYDGDYESVHEDDLVRELMILDMCQNTGPNLHDIVDFYNASQEEIDSTLASITELAEKED